jgi:hypothetical protein
MQETYLVLLQLQNNMIHGNRMLWESTFGTSIVLFCISECCCLNRVTIFQDLLLYKTSGHVSVTSDFHTAAVLVTFGRNSVCNSNRAFIFLCGIDGLYVLLPISWAGCIDGFFVGPYCIEPLFYPTTIVHFPPLLRLACGRSADLGYVNKTSWQRVTADGCQIK